MFGPMFFWCSVLAYLVAVATSEVIVREVNKKEGSLCFLTDGTAGICRRDCGRLARQNQEEFVCNPDGDQPLYCCYNNIDAKYPTLHEVCQERRLAAEFIERDNEESAKLRQAFNAAVEVYIEHTKGVEKWCSDTTLPKDEEERGYYSSECSQVPQPIELSPSFRYKDTMSYISEAMLLGWRSPVSWVCPGVLVHPTYILASADCLMEMRNQKSGTKPDIILGGQTGERPIKSSSSRTNYQSFTAHRILTHPDNKLALVEAQITRERNILKRPLPICLWTEKAVPPNIASAVGFRNASDDMQIGGIFTKSNASLVQKCENHGNISTICAHTEFHTKDTCDDISWSYLQIVEDDWLRIPHLAGIASLNSTCNATTITEYISIYPYLEWIESIISVKQQS